MASKEDLVIEESHGYYSVGKFTYQIKTAANYPFCHFCRKRAAQVVVIIPTDNGNPRHFCYECAKQIIAGFGRLPNI